MKLGTFATEVDAASAYDDAAKKYHGGRARLNAIAGGARLKPAAQAECRP